MITMTTWKTFLLYALDMMTKDDCASSIYFITGEDIKIDASSYDSSTQVIKANNLWPSGIEIDDCIRDPNIYKEYLENIASYPSANVGELMKLSTCVPVFMFMADIPRNDVLVHTLQQHLYETYGLGSIWLDGMIFDGNSNEYPQDDARVREKWKEHLKKSSKVAFQTRATPGRLYRDGRLNYLNDMNESSQRKYLNKHYKIDTEGMSASKVYAMMVDLFVDESSGPQQDQVRDAARYNYKHRKDKKRK